MRMLWKILFNGDLELQRLISNNWERDQKRKNKTNIIILVLNYDFVLYYYV